jgi:glutaredoxin 2
MKKSLFQILAFINRLVLPRMSKRDLTKLKTWEKAIVAWRYYVTTKAIE